MLLFRLLLLFTIVPLTELWLLLWLGSVTSVGFTVLVVLVTGFLGATLARYQGWQTWQRIQLQLQRGEPPAAALVDGLMILIAGALLITPGLLTDATGFLLLMPPVRARLRAHLLSWLTQRTVVQIQMFRSAPGGFDARRPSEPGDVIDAEFTRHPERDDSHSRLP